MTKRWVRMWLAVAAAPVLVASSWGAAHADGLPPAPDTSPPPTSQPEPTPTYETQYDPPVEEGKPQLSCSVYANGSGMGSYCVELGGDEDAKTLQERFGGMEFQRCRYDEVPESLKSSVPENPRPGEQWPMLRMCLDNINWDTSTGGPNRSVSFEIVWVTEETETEDVENPLNDFLWKQYENSTQLPVPHLRANPNPVPLVNAETAFTFTWLDPATQEEYDDAKRRVEVGGDLVMRAVAKEVTVDPNVKGMDPVSCSATAKYPQGPDGAPCTLTFEHSSADAQERSTVEIPDDVVDSYYVTVSVDWEIRYGPSGDLSNTLGDGFRMVLHQALPVQEAQGVNRPPRVSVN